jgi:hypothetical protein
MRSIKYNIGDFSVFYKDVKFRVDMIMDIL